MARNIILVGDPLSQGGNVIGGSPRDLIDGRAVARKGDLVRCARHGTRRIVEGDPAMLVDGQPVALEGHRAECGCVLLAGGCTGTVG